MLPFINIPFQHLSSALGASADELKLVASFLLSYPLAAILKRISDAKPWQKNVFAIAVSTFYLVGLFDMWAGVWTVLVDAAGAYAIATYVEGPYMPWIAFAFLMGHLSLSHIYRSIVADPSIIDITGAQMVLVMKLTSFCWNIHDGKLPDRELADWQKERALRQMPSLLDYAGFVAFFPSFMVGPAFDFVDYRQWIETSMFDLPPGADPSRAPPTRKKRKIPRSSTPSIYKLFTGLAWVLAFLKFSAWYQPAMVLQPGYSSRYGFLRRVWHLYVLAVTQRMKYYGVWTLTEGACVLAGIGYKGIDPKTGRADWSRLENVNPAGVELSQNCYGFLENWNKNTNSWLRNSIYLRVTPKGKKPGFRASVATFVTSAFWHGFEPGYYLTFVVASLVQTVAKNARRLLRPFFLTPDGSKPTSTKPYYDFATWFMTHLAFSFLAAPFYLLKLPACMKAWGQVYFCVLIGLAVSMAFLASPGKQWLVKQLKERNSTKLVRTTSSDIQKEPVLGLPDDPEKDIDEIVAEVRAELEARKKSGQPVTQDVKQIVEEKLGKKLD